MSGSRNDDNSTPSAPGWYPDPWSATGKGERYFDGRRWGSSERPLGRETVALSDVRRTRRRSRAGGRFLRVARPVAVVAALLGVGWIITRFQHSGSQRATVELPTLPGGGATNHPPPSAEEASRPLGTPAPVPPGPGRFEVLRDQPDAATVPVAYDPCRPIHYVVNGAHAPSDGAALIRAAFARLHTATGLQFVDDGATTEAPNKNRPAYQPGRYGTDRWAPVLVVWSDENAYPELAGYVAGVGGSSAVYARPDRLVYVTGQVVLDRVQMSRRSIPRRSEVEAIILHEFGHLVGLDHTSDRSEIMYSESEFNVRDYGRGDLRGLAMLGTQACFPDV